MEFKINKLKIVANKKIDEDIRTDKIHDNKNEVKVRNNMNQEKNNQSYSENKKNKKKFFTVDGFKYKKSSISIDVENDEVLYENHIKGYKIDVKK